MLKKTITYEDYDGNTRTEDLYFYLSKAELMEMELSTPGGLAKKLESITKAQNGAEIVKVFKDIILNAYGEKSDDGKSFIKKKNGVRLCEEFEQTEAYNQLFTELIMDPDKAALFINGIMPKDLAGEANNLNLQAKMSGIPSGNN